MNTKDNAKAHYTQMAETASQAAQTSGCYIVTASHARLRKATHWPRGLFKHIARHYKAVGTGHALRQFVDEYECKHTGTVTVTKAADLRAVQHIKY
jgi:hypothetical protein